MAHSERDINKDWDLWLAHESTETPKFGELSFEQIAVLKKQLDIRLIDFGLTPVKGQPGRLTPKDLIDHFSEPWARGIALQLAQDVRERGIGRAPELVDVVERYARYFDAFSQNNQGPLLAETLSARLDEADQAMIQLEKLTALRSGYMQGLEDRKSTASSVVQEQVNPEGPGVLDLQKSFLDRIEKRSQ